MNYILATVFSLGVIPVDCAQTAAPVLDEFLVCYHYECGTRQVVSLDAQQWQTIRALFTPAAESAPRERAMIRRAIAQMEVFVGVLTGTSGDLGGNVAGAGLPGQMDCIDESTNTATYLTLFEKAGLLSWHQGQESAQRSKWNLDIHWAAVIRENGSDKRYAVDSWFLDNGQPPYIQRLEDWRDTKDFAAQDE